MSMAKVHRPGISCWDTGRLFEGGWLSRAGAALKIEEKCRDLNLGLRAPQCITIMPLHSWPPRPSLYECVRQRVVVTGAALKNVRKSGNLNAVSLE